MASKKLETFLDEHHVPSLVLEHEPAYTAQEAAAVSHISGKVLLKTIILKIEGRFAMAVIHARDRLDLEKLRQNLGVFDVLLANENEICDI